MIRSLHSSLIALSLILAASPARAAFQHPLMSPRAAAMGSSSLAVSEDSSAAFLNPAGIARMKVPDAYFMYNQLYAGLDGVGSIGEGLLSLGLPTRLGTFAFGLGGFRASGLKQELTASLSYARPVLSDRLQAGVTIKHLHHNYSAGSDPLAAADPVFRSGTSRSAISLDAGFIASLGGPLRVAFAVRNLNSPDVGLSSEDRVPREFQTGMAYDFGSVGVKATADLLLRGASGSDTGGRVLPTFGFEKALYSDVVVFRLGANPLEFTGGFGLQTGPVGFDYALVLRRNLMQDNAGSHRVGMRYQFGSRR